MSYVLTLPVLILLVKRVPREIRTPDDLVRSQAFFR